MGYSSWWLAVLGKEPERVLGELGLARGDREAEDFDDGDVVSGTLPTGWFFVFLNRDAWVSYKEPRILALSAGCRVLTCEAEEHAMYSTATGYADGRRLWHVEHAEPAHLGVEGKPPPPCDAIVESLRSLQEEADRAGEEVDYLFDIPVNLAHAITGFRYGDPSPEGSAFHVLQRAETAAAESPPAPPERPWWRFW